MKRSPWAIWAAIVAGSAVVLSGASDGLLFLVFVGIFLLAFATVGALVASRRPRNPIGWLLLASAAAYAIGGAVASESEDGGTGALDATAAWVGAWIWFIAIVPVATFGLLLFPAGRLPSRRWRPAAWLAGAGLASVIAGAALAPGRFPNTPVSNPVGIRGAGPALDVLATAGGIALVLAVLAALASLRARYRAAAPEERQQLKWLGYSGALLAAGLAVVIPVEAIMGAKVADFTNAVITLAVATVPVAMGIAILRHRLYDIDLVIRRTLVYGALTATLAGAYLGLVLLAGLALGDSGLAVAASTLAVAALARPARARIQAAVDRRFYRRRYDASQTLEAFGARLRDELDLEALGADLRGVVRETVQPAHVSLWLREGRG